MTRRNAFLIGLVFELVAVFGLFIPSMALLSSGTPIVIKTVPVDPWSPLRGEYVILGYEVGQGLPENLEINTPLYVVLEERDGIYERVSYTQRKPKLLPNQVCLRGRVQWQNAVFPDIAQYFVEEGSGRELEQMQGSHRLLVHARVNGSCRAIIESLEIGEAAPIPPDEFGRMPIEPMPMEAKPVTEPVQ